MASAKLKSIKSISFAIEALSDRMVFLPRVKIFFFVLKIKFIKKKEKINEYGYLYTSASNSEDVFCSRI